MAFPKALGLVAAVALALAAPASAANLTSPAGTSYTGTVKFESTAPHVVMDTSNGSSLTCTTTGLEWKAESHGLLVPVKGPIAKLSFEGCGTTVVSVLKAGTMEVHKGHTGESEVKYDAVTWRGYEITTKALGFPDCIYAWSEPIVMGGLTGSSLQGGKTAIFDLSATIPVANSPLCPVWMELTGIYRIASPDFLDVD